MKMSARELKTETCFRPGAFSVNLGADPNFVQNLLGTGASRPNYAALNTGTPHAIQEVAALNKPAPTITAAAFGLG